MLSLLRPAWVAAQAPDARLLGLCRNDIPPQKVIESLVEEAETAGLDKAILKRLLAAGYGQAEGSRMVREILCLLLEAENDGLPPDLLFEKMEEGLAKRASLARIREVIQAKIEDLRYVRSLLNGSDSGLFDDPGVERVARLLSLNVDRTVLEALFSPALQAPKAMRIVAAEIIGYGTTAGLEPELLEQVVHAGLSARAFTADWSFFIKVVARARKAGIEDRQIMATAVEVLYENGSLDEFADELGVTLDDRPGGPNDEKPF